ncbi:hypothetical protein LIER_39294 [Lithospermum erythrorhizon]|uniref:ATP-dependent DNA helicase n=1 Tax=Lithospermum erythrorhizon TaxID=34254 RepID=A0AAV3QF62_LITER
MYPAVIQLQVHLPNFQSIQFEDDTNLEELLQNERLRRTMLTEFFNINATDPKTKDLKLLYKDFPRYYVWDSQMRTWTKRKKGTVIGRLSTVNPIENERYYLRVLLNNVRSPTSFDSLLYINRLHCKSFQEAAHMRGLLQDDSDIDKTMEEASTYRMSSELRRLFATLLHYCKPSDPPKLFKTYYEYMVEDFRKTQCESNMSEEQIMHKVLQGVNDTLESLGKNVNEYNLVSFKYVTSDFKRFTREIAYERSIPVPEEDLLGINQLNSQQKTAFDTIFHHVILEKSGVYFVDGPGGTGKSFLYKVLIAHIRSRGYIALIVASSGIAASSFLGGRTAHSRFKIPIDGGPNVKCQMSFQRSEAELIKTSKIIIWAEAPMAEKSAIHALNHLLQELCENKSLFGGKLVVFGGDFRQVLPVVPRGTRKEQIDTSIISSTL